jgi:hypothetical protein
MAQVVLTQTQSCWLIGLSPFYIHFFVCLFAEVGKILFVENLVGEKRRERLDIGEYRGTWKLVIPTYLFLKQLFNWHLYKSQIN